MSNFYNTGQEIIVTGLFSAFSAQLIKFGAYWIASKKLDFKWLFQTGGMPSSHSSAMTAMATSVGFISGFNSVDFAISLGIALVVMYDAACVRRAAGRMAGILNKITEDFYQHHPETFPDRLRELLGHTPFEVFVGALFGVLIAIAVHQHLILG